MTTINLETFSNRLIQLKTERNLLQKDIAKNSGLSLRTYQYYEKGEREPSMSALVALANLFDTSIDYLIGRSDCPNRH